MSLASQPIQVYIELWGPEFSREPQSFYTLHLLACGEKNNGAHAMTDKKQSSSSSWPSAQWIMRLFSVTSSTPAYSTHRQLDNQDPCTSSTVTAFSNNTHPINSQRNAVRVVFMGPCSDNPANAQVCKSSDSVKAPNQVALLIPPRLIIIANVNITVTRYAGVQHPSEYIPRAILGIYRNQKKVIHRKEMRFVLTELVLVPSGRCRSHDHTGSRTPYSSGKADIDGILHSRATRKAPCFPKRERMSRRYGV